jgi:hypothetical protein
MAGLGNNMRLGGRIDYSLLSGKAASRQDGLANPVDRLLPRLEGVQKAGSCWRARCPACGGQGRKVSITVGDDGRVLLTCFSCHDTPAVLGAVGLSIADLFPRRVTHATTPEERRELAQRARESQWAAALGVLAPEAGVIEVAASMIERGAALTADDLARVRLAAQRIHSAREVLA